MAWITVAEASSTDELRTLTPAVNEIPNGSPVRITITLPAWLPLAHLADLAGAEWFAQRFVGAVKVTDVSSPDHLYTIEIDGTAIGLFWFILVPLLVVVLGALAIIGINAWQHVTVEADITQQAKVQQATEQARIDASNALVAKGYSLSDISKWLSGITTPTAQQQAADPSLMDTIKKALSNPLTDIGIGAGILIIILIIFMAVKK